MARDLSHCIARVAAAGRITANEALALLEDVSARAEKMRLTGEPDPFVTAAGELAASVKAAAKERTLDALLNANARARLRGVVDENGGVANAFQSLRAEMHFEAGAKSAESAEGLWHALGRRWIGAAINKINLAGAFKAAKSGLLDNEIAEALWRMSGGTANEKVRISKAGQAVADAIKAPMDEAVERLNTIGAHIEKAEGYALPTVWDARQLRKAAGPGASADDAFGAWWARERPRMADRTFRDVMPKEGQSQADAEREFGKSVFFGRVTGIDLSGGFPSVGMAEGTGDYVPYAFEGTRNIGRKLSQHRVVFWKDAQSWLEHSQEFGGGASLLQHAVQVMDSSARRYALMQKFGTNPAANLNQVIEDVKGQYRNTEPDAVNAFGKQEQQLKDTMGRLDGLLNAPMNADRQRLAETILTLEAEMHLGGVSLTHLTAAPFTLSAQLTHHGINHWNAIGEIMRTIFSSASDADKRAVLAEAGGYVHGIHASLAAAMRRTDAGIPGWVSYLGAKFMQMTGLPYFIDKLQADGVKGMLMANLGHQVGRAFADLEPHVRAMLGRYGLTEGEWDLLRNVENPTTVDGVRYVTPADIKNVSDDALLEHLDATNYPEDQQARVLRDARWNIGDKLLMYFNDAAEHSTVTPGVRERGNPWVLGSARPGSWDYLARRFLLQFKMWPLAAYHQIWLQNLSQSMGRLEAAQNIGWILALATAGGALRMSVNDAVNGRPQRNYLNPVTALAAFAQGGGLGIYGDFLFGEVNRMGAGLVGTIGGPVASDLDRLLQIYGRFKTDVETGKGSKALDHMWPDLVKFGIGHVPFGNLIYLKSALDYLLWYHIYEAMSPGWWERTNRRMQKEQDSHMIGYTPGGKVPYVPIGATH